jgi:ribosome assembly protein YihI (activator of Der GTPase)
MNLTLVEIKEKIAEQMDEVDILEVLEINSWDLVEAFSDRIEAKYEQFCNEIHEEEED